MNEDNMKYFFSVITVCWNDKDGLIRTHQSMREQTCKDFEWIIVDGDSSDGSKSFLEQLSLKDSTWTSEPDEGLYDAMNKGMAEAKGGYIIFMNSGDVLADPDVLNIIKNEACEKGLPDFIYGDAFDRFSNGANLLKKAKTHQWLWYGMFTHHQAMFYKRSAIGNLKYRLEYKLAADYGFTSEFLRQVNHIEYVGIPICIFESGGLTSTWSAHMIGIKEQWVVGRKLQKKSIIFCLLTLSLHLIKHAVVRLFPRVMRLVRYKN